MSQAPSLVASPRKLSVASDQALIAAVLGEVRAALPPGHAAEVTIGSTLDDVGLDSLARMAVVNRLEEVFGIRFTPESLYDLESCGDLIEYVKGRADAKPPPAVAKPHCAFPAPTGKNANVAATPHERDVRDFPECVAFQRRLAEQAAAGGANPFFRAKQSVEAATAVISGRRVTSFTSFDYLGLATDPAVIEAAQSAIRQFGTSASASRLVGGENTIVAALDEALSQLLGTEAALAFPSGYGTNASLFGHLFAAEDLILYDELAHNSIVQGATLSAAQRRAFPHNDFAFVDRLLADVRAKHRRVVIAIEGVYSMDGDYPDLPEFISVKQRHGALLYVDEAHSLGVLGARGRGICEHFGVNPAEGDFWMGTLSKALASGGGYLAGRASLIQYLKYTTPAFVFSTAISPANAAAALAAVRTLLETTDRVARLRKNAALFLRLAREAGLNTGASRDTAIVPVILGDSRRCLAVSEKLLQAGIDAQPILYPAVPEAASRVRFFITANHTEEQIQEAIRALRSIARN